MSRQYREYPPPARLRPWVQCFWTQESAAPAGVHRVLPDGCIDILFEATATVGAEIYVVGMMTRPLMVSRTAATSYTAVRFRAGGAAAFFRLPLHGLTDARIDLAELWPQASSLRDRLAEAPTVTVRLALLAEELARRLDEASVRRHAGCSFAIRQLSIEPDTGVDDLCARLGISRQALAKSFREYVGVPPKTLGRILRLQRALSLIARPAAAARPGLRWADLAIDAGYYDQSHLIAEFRDLVGLTPGAFLVESGNGIPSVPDGDAGTGPSP